MKNLYFYILFLSVSFGYGQTFGYTFFDSGTLEEWTNSNGSTENLSLAERNPFSLKKSCDGSNSVNGEMAIRNPAYFQDNYYSGEAAKIFMEIKNDNSFDLHLRLGFTDFEGSKIVFTEPTVIPANTGSWSIVEFETSPQSFSLIEGENSIAEVLTNVSEMWIIHNPEISFNGAYENGDFEIDTIGTIYLLGRDDFKTQNVNIYPIPTKDILYIESKHSKIERLEIYDSLGRIRKIESTNLQQIDLSDFSNGVYFLKLISGSEIQTKKIIKK